MHSLSKLLQDSQIWHSVSASGWKVGGASEHPIYKTIQMLLLLCVLLYQVFRTLACGLLNILILSLYTQRGLVVGIIIPVGHNLDKGNILGQLVEFQAK